MMSTEELVSVVKLSFVSVVFWCFGFVLGEKVEGKNEKLQAVMLVEKG